ncbi:MAG TPA: class I SAM-dependent methyltransferase [Candidatus Dormibacteraeota bacterium]|nr:class I SAM-dependent methyltransferase [Candidatus Dormibacteraeota bacterium]
MGSIAFDQAAPYYDRTRRLDPDVHAAVIDLLVGELRGRRRCLEIGVGTGRIAFDLHRAGVAMAGVDLSRPMLDRLVEKGGGSAPFPLAVADATALPAPSRAFAAGLACHVLHLIPQWRAAADELVRVVAPGGVVLVDIGGDAPGTGREVSRYFFAQTRLHERVRPGLNDPEELDALMVGHGLVPRLLPPVRRRVEYTVENMIRRLEEGVLSGCWPLDEAERRQAGDATREWARQRFGAVDAPYTVEAEIEWRAYDVPAAP